MVTGVSGKGDYLISVGTDEIVNIYNIKTTILEREMNLANESYQNLSGVIKLTNSQNEMIITDHLFGITWFSYDLENNMKNHPDISYKPVVKLFDHVSDQNCLFATSNDKGVVKIYKREEIEDNDGINVDITKLRKFVGHKGQVNDIGYFKDGTYVTAGEDGTVRIWSCRRDVIKVGKVQAGGAGCCGKGKCTIF
jgi:WD40 repeat protein